MNRQCRKHNTAARDVQHGTCDPRTLRHLRRAAFASATAVSLAMVMWPAAAASVTWSGDVSPQFTQGPTVDLTGQAIYLGFTNGAVGTLGTLNVTGGGSLTAAQIAPGTGGLGIGVVSVTGAESIINLTGGPNTGLDIGSWGTGIVTVSSGGRIACSSTLACPFSGIGNGAGSTGTLAINGGSVSGLGSLAVGLGSLLSNFGTPGANTTATLSITNGGTLSSTGYNSVANNNGQTGLVTGNVTIDGAGSSWTIARDLANGGGQADLGIATATNSIANVTISNGGNLTVTGSRSDPATDSSLPVISMSSVAGATSTMTVTTGGSVLFGGDSGVLNVGGSGNTIGGSATLNITAGGTVSGTGPNGLVFVDIGQNQATGTINISGPGSQLVVAGVGGLNTSGLDGIGGLIEVGRNHGNGGGSGTLNVSGGGSVLISDNGQAASTGFMGLVLANGTGSSGTVTVSGTGSSIVISSTGGSATTPVVEIGNGGTGQMTISNGGSMSVQGTGERNFVVGNSSTGSGVLVVTTGGQINASWFVVGNNGGSGVATINNSTVNLDGVVNYNNGLIGAGVRVGRGVGANGVLNLVNGAVVNINNSIASASVILGGTSTLPGGTGTLNMSGGSTINFTGSAASASLQVGGTNGTGSMTMTGDSVVNMGATGSVLVASSAASTGNLTIAAGSVVNADNVGIGGNSDTVAGGSGSAVVTGAGSVLSASGDSGFISVGRSGTGSLIVSDQGTVAATILNIGRAGGGVGALTVDNGVINLSGQQNTTGDGAAFSIGNRGGTGVATISNSVVTITNMGSGGASLNVGGSQINPLGTGTLGVSGSQINVIAAPGQAAVRVGYDGTGTATLTNSTLNIGSNPTAGSADGSLLIASQPGSTGVLSLNAGTVVNTGFVGVGVSQPGVIQPNGSVTQFNGGSGHLILNDSTIDTTTFEIGSGGLLSGDGGVITATGNVIVGGTISPGNSPGRITIDCNLITLPGSRLILDVLGTGTVFNVDHLILGNDATFNLSNLQIVFNFLGNTDPNAFAASGGFNLDNFFESLNLTNGDITGLSTVFGPGQTWANVVNSSEVTVVSNAYDVTNLQLQSNGSFSVSAVPVPEPSTWAMLVLGLLALTAMALRRQCVARPL
jgi:T5SS/PEP-CTERM-associated repeat protein